MLRTAICFVGLTLATCLLSGCVVEPGGYWHHGGGWWHHGWYHDHD